MGFNTLIIMNEDTSGYGHKSRRPSGYCKLTMPNRLTCYVQGLNQLPRGQTYRLYLMSKAKEKRVSIGRFEIDKEGSKEIRWTIEPSNINNSKITAREVDGALITVEGNNVQGLKVPLVGFAGEPYLWVGLMVDTIEESKATEERVNIEEPKATEERVNIGEPKATEERVNIEESKATEERVNIEEPRATEESMSIEEPRAPEEREIIEEPLNRASLDEIELLKGEIELLKGEKELLLGEKELLEGEKELLHGEKEISEGEKEKLKGEAELLKIEIEKLKQRIKSLEDIIDAGNMRDMDFRQEEQHVSYFAASQRMKEIFDKSMPMNPFESPDLHIRWVRITQPELMSLPQLSYKWTSQPLITNAYSRYKHFIMGRDEHMEQYYLGVPDTFYPRKLDILNIDKIESFRCCRNVQPRVGEHGYWIARL